jgi:hypothetical protein
VDRENQARFISDSTLKPYELRDLATVELLTIACELSQDRQLVLEVPHAGTQPLQNASCVPSFPFRRRTAAGVILKLNATLYRDSPNAAAHLMMKHASDGGWSLLWPLIQGEADFGEKMIESLSFPDGGNVKIVPKLTEAQLGELYAWLVEHYPYAEPRSSFGFMYPGETAAFFRDSVLESLIKRGTFAACDALRAVMQKFPDYAWLARPLEQAEWLARAATWRPVSIAELLALASNREKRLVETGADLVDAILQSLKRLDATFREEVPAAMNRTRCSGPRTSRASPTT